MTHDFLSRIENIINRDSQADDSEVEFQLKQLLYERDLQKYAGKDALSILDLVTENLRQLDDEHRQAPVIKTGFNDFDTKFGGFRSGEFIVVGGRPAMGKTQFLINLSLSISTVTPVLYVTLDLSEFLLTSRFLSTVSGIPVNNILQNDVSALLKNQLHATGEAFARRQLFIHYCDNTSIAALKASCQKQIKEKNIQVVIVDYLQLLSSSNHRKNRELEVSYISRELKNMAKDHNVCVIASSQLSRALESRYEKRPMLSDLRDSGAIEQDADKVLFIHRPDYYDVTEDDVGNDLVCVVEIMVAKNRNGPLGTVTLNRDRNFTAFYDLKKEFTFSPVRMKEIEDAPF